MGLWGGVLLVMVLIVGGVAHLVGLGFLGYRVILHGEGELYVLNLTMEERYVSVEGREKKVIHARDAQLVELVGGRSEVEILNEDGSLYRRWEVEMSRSDVLLNLSKETCLAVTDITSLYQGDVSGVEFSALLGPEVEVYELGSRNVVWPRKDPPPRVDPSRGPVLSVEIVGCPLLEDRGFLKEYLLMRLQDRMGRRE